MPGLPQAARRAAGVRRALPAHRRILQLQQRVVRAARGPAQRRRVRRAQGGRRGREGRRRVGPRRGDELGVGARQRAELAALAPSRQHHLRRAPSIALQRAGQSMRGFIVLLRAQPVLSMASNYSAQRNDMMAPSMGITHLLEHAVRISTFPSELIISHAGIIWRM